MLEPLLHRGWRDDGIEVVARRKKLDEPETLFFDELFFGLTESSEVDAIAFGAGAPDSLSESHERESIGLTGDVSSSLRTFDERARVACARRLVRQIDLDFGDERVLDETAVDVTECLGDEAKCDVRPADAGIVCPVEDFDEGRSELAAQHRSIDRGE